MESAQYLYLNLKNKKIEVIAWNKKYLTTLSPKTYLLRLIRINKKEIVFISSKNHKVNQEQSRVDMIILKKFSKSPVKRRRGGIIYSRLNLIVISW